MALDYKTIKEKTIKIVGNLNPLGQVNINTRLGDVIDSFDIMNLVLDLESEFGISIPEEKVCSSMEGNKYGETSVKRIVDYIHEQTR